MEPHGDARTARLIETIEGFGSSALKLRARDRPPTLAGFLLGKRNVEADAEATLELLVSRRFRRDDDLEEGSALRIAL